MFSLVILIGAHFVKIEPAPLSLIRISTGKGLRTKQLNSNANSIEIDTFVVQFFILYSFSKTIHVASSFWRKFGIKKMHVKI